jgi:hypothetical protein
MKSYDVVGYTRDGAAYCTGCAPDPEHMDPIFCGSEWDSYPVCDKCGGVIDEVGLTGDGLEYEGRYKFFRLLHAEREARKAAARDPFGMNLPPLVRP